MALVLVHNMKTILFLMISTILAAVACNDDQLDETIETWWINSAKLDCVGVGPMSCLQVQKGAEIDPAAWEFFYSGINGFEYEPGNIYQIKVNITEREAPIPADASSKIYELVEVVSKKADPALRLTNIWKVTKVADIENPTGFRNKEALTFEFNASAKTYLGNMGCNSIRGDIKENDGEKLILGSGATTMMACPDMSIDQAITKALIDTRGYQLENNQLYLLNEAGETLMTFQAVD
jgi:heat shock protein HslJ